MRPDFGVDSESAEHGLPALCLVPQPSDANIHGDVGGAWIMMHADTAGSIPASRRANGRVVTVALNSCQFLQPVFIGDRVSFYSSIVATGRTSITVSVRVYAQRMGLEIEIVKVAEATLTFVATGLDRKPRVLPSIDGNVHRSMPVWGAAAHPAALTTLAPIVDGAAGPGGGAAVS